MWGNNKEGVKGRKSKLSESQVVQGLVRSGYAEMYKIKYSLGHICASRRPLILVGGL